VTRADARIRIRSLLEWARSSVADDLSRLNDAQNALAEADDLLAALKSAVAAGRDEVEDPDA
jgi:hypothetical protein